MEPIDDNLRRHYPPELPYGFAQRTAAAIMSGDPSRLWEVLLSMTPRAGLVVGAVATALVVIGFSGGGPGLFEAIEHYGTLGELIQLP